MSADDCILCGNPIDAGEAWLAGDRDGVPLRVHAACLYRAETDGTADRSARWEPQTETAT